MDQQKRRKSCDDVWSGDSTWWTHPTPRKLQHGEKSRDERVRKMKDNRKKIRDPHQRKEVFEKNILWSHTMTGVVVPTILSLYERIDCKTNKTQHIPLMRCLWDCYEKGDFFIDFVMCVGEAFRWMWKPLVEHLSIIDKNKRLVQWYHREIPTMWKHIEYIVSTWEKGEALDGRVKMVIANCLCVGDLECAKRWHELFWSGDKDALPLTSPYFMHCFKSFCKRNEEDAMVWMAKHVIISKFQRFSKEQRQKNIKLLKDIQEKYIENGSLVVWTIERAIQHIQ
jgi:hypothetical protein